MGRVVGNKIGGNIGRPPKTSKEVRREYTRKLIAQRRLYKEREARLEKYYLDALEKQRARMGKRIAKLLKLIEDAGVIENDVKE